MNPMLDKLKFETLMDSIYRNSFGENRKRNMFYALYHASRRVGVIRPIGWLTGFMDYFSPYASGNSNPYPENSLAHYHYEQGRVCALISYSHYYNENSSTYKVSFN